MKSVILFFFIAFLNSILGLFGIFRVSLTPTRRRVALRLRLFKVESDINGVLPALGRAPAIYFVSPLEQASLCARG